MSLFTSGALVSNILRARWETKAIPKTGDTMDASVAQSMGVE